MRRAYGTRSTKPFWRYRLGAIGITLVSVFAVMFAFSLQIVITGVDQFLHRILPWADEAIALFDFAGEEVRKLLSFQTA